MKNFFHTAAIVAVSIFACIPAHATKVPAPRQPIVINPDLQIDPLMRKPTCPLNDPTGCGI